MAVAVQPGAVFINTKILRDIFMVQFKTRIRKESRKAGADQRGKYYNGG